MGVLKGDCVAIDGFKFKAVNNRDKNFTKGKIASRTAHLVASIERYLDEMVRIDRQEEGEVRAEKITNLARRCEHIRQEVERLVDMGEALRQSPDSQISLTDPDSRSMATSAKGSGFVGYNAQSAVDTETHLIVAHDVINAGHDRDQLAPMAKAAKAALGRDAMNVVAPSRDIASQYPAGQWTKDTVAVEKFWPVTRMRLPQLSPDQRHLATARKGGM